MEFYDLIVCGGGTAGCFAALSCAKEGAKVLLVEKNGMLGGTITTGAVNIPGLFHAWGKQIIGGICWDLIEELSRSGGATIPEMAADWDSFRHRHFKNQITVDCFEYAALTEAWCRQYGVTVLLHSMICEAKEEADGITVTVAKKDGLERIFAKYAIDATGDGNLLSLLRYPLQKRERLQPATPMCHVKGYDAESIRESALRCYLEEAAKSPDFPAWADPGVMARKLLSYRLDIHVECPLDADTSLGKSELEQKARAQVYYLLQLLRRFSGMEQISIADYPAECGVRETNRMVGEHIVTAEEFCQGIRYEDAVCYAFYPIDRHEPSGIHQVFLEEGIVPTLPYRALIPKGSKHVLGVGRILSSDADANSALRVQAVCMATGQVAGCACALATRSNAAVADISYAALCDLLKKQGAIVPR